MLYISMALIEREALNILKKPYRYASLIVLLLFCKERFPKKRGANICFYILHLQIYFEKKLFFFSIQLLNYNLSL